MSDPVEFARRLGDEKVARAKEQAAAQVTAAKDRLRQELAAAPGLRFAVAIFQGLHQLGRIGGDRPTPIRGRMTVIDTTAIEVETRRAR